MKMIRSKYSICHGLFNHVLWKDTEVAKQTWITSVERIRKIEYCNEKN